MKFNFKHEKTTIIPIEGSLVQVSNLPDELKNEVETLDRLLQDKIGVLYELEKVELATLVKTQQIQQMVSAFVKKIKEDQRAAEVNKEESLKDEKPTKKK